MSECIRAANTPYAVLVESAKHTSGAPVAKVKNNHFMLDIKLVQNSRQ